MKNYASRRANSGKTSYRTPSLFKANKAIAAAKIKAFKKHPKNFNQGFYGKA